MERSHIETLFDAISWGVIIMFAILIAAEIGTRIF